MHFQPGAGVLDSEGVVHLGDHAVIEAQHGHHTVLQPGAGHARLLGDPGGFHRFGAENKAQRVRVVHGNVENHPGAAGRFVQPPALQVRRQVDRVEHAREQRLADGS